MNNALSITKIINGLSKTLSIANQIIPLYKQAKPYINKLSNITIPTQSIKQPIENNKQINNTITYDNQPTFFQ